MSRDYVFICKFIHWYHLFIKMKIIFKKRLERRQNIFQRFSKKIKGNFVTKRNNF